MQATAETEITRHITVQMGSKTYETEHEYTRAQAEEVHKMVVESAREAVGDDGSIESRKFGIQLTGLSQRDVNRLAEAATFAIVAIALTSLVFAFTLVWDRVSTLW